MQTLLRIEDIAQRAREIGLTPQILASEAGVHFTTFYRALKDPDSITAGNLRALGEALVRIEIRQRDRLLALHPVEEAA